MIQQIVQLVEVFDHQGDAIENLCFKAYLTEESLYMPDKFSELLVGGNKTAKVGREIVETIGGPGYSSVKVSTYIEVTCDQSDKYIKEAARLCLAECSILNEEGVKEGYAGMLRHRLEMGLKND